MASVGVVIVNWNGWRHLEICLQSLSAQSFQDFSVIIADNGSNDGSLEFVRANFPDVDLIELEQNYGFAYPNNLAIEKAFECNNLEFVLTLNNDTKLEPDFLSQMIACAERHPAAGSVQPKILNFFEPTKIDSAGMLISKEMCTLNRGLGENDVGQFDQEEEIFAAVASAALYRCEALLKVALVGDRGVRDFFDSDYFAYNEDGDLAWRLRLAGYQAFYTPEAVVYHVHSATGKSYSEFKAFHIHRNLYFNIIKNLPMPQLIRAFFLMPRFYLASFFSILKRRGAASELNSLKYEKGEGPIMLVLRGWCEVLRMLSGMLVKRRQIQAMRVVGNKEIERWFTNFKADFSKVLAG